MTEFVIICGAVLFGIVEMALVSIAIDVNAILKLMREDGKRRDGWLNG